MTGIKICGITNREDALCAAASGADAVGFIFHEASSRYITPQRAREITAVLPYGIVRIGVFVNGEEEVVRRTAGSCGLDMIQLHGDESPEYCRRFPPGAIIKAVFPGKPEEWFDDYRVRAFLVDSRRPGRYGGTGEKADWGLAARVARRYPLILAGGLNGENITDALTQVEPGAVDINSGIEISPGIKDHERMKRIIAIIKNRDSAVSGGTSSDGGSIFTKRDINFLSEGIGQP